MARRRMTAKAAERQDQMETAVLVAVAFIACWAVLIVTAIRSLL